MNDLLGVLHHVTPLLVVYQHYIGSCICEWIYSVN